MLRLYNRKAVPYLMSRIARSVLAVTVVLGGACNSGDPVAGLGPIPTGSLAMGIDGLPTDVPGNVVIAGAQGYQKSLTAGETLSGLKPGSYLVTATDVTSDGDRFTPTPATQTVAVTPGSVPVTAAVAYQQVTGRLAVTVNGLPAGVPAAVQVGGPAGYAHTVVASEILTGLAPGIYTVQSPTLLVNTDHYDAQTASQEMAVSAVHGTTPQVAVTYAVASGALSVVVDGLPAPAQASIGVTGPQGFHADVGASAVLGGLVPGNYSVSAGSVTAGGLLYVPLLTEQSAAVLPSLVPVVRTVTYARATGALGITLSGLPGSLGGSLSVTGPGGFLQSVTASQTLNGLVPGSYTITAFAVSSGGTTYNPQPASQTVSVVFNSSVSAGVSYSPVTGSLQLSVSGLPGGVPASVDVTGPGGVAQHHTASRTISGLPPGIYTISAVAVTWGSTTYTPLPLSQNATVTGGAQAGASVVYAPSTGSLNLTIGGLPGGVAASVSVTGPGGFSQSLTASQSLTGLTPGSYSISAAAVASGGTTYTGAPALQSIGVTSGAVSPASVFYSGGGGGGATLNLTISGVYLTQATQRFDGTVPLVAGRSAYLRVFAVANQANTAQPSVRVRLYNGVALVQTYTIAAPAGSVPLAANESSLANSWNVLVPAALVQPNLKVLADVDPGSLTPESSDNDNQFPLSGVAGPVDVRTLPTFQVRMVPVLQQVNSLQGNVTAGNVNNFLTDLLLLLPVGAYSADVRAPYTTTAPVLVNDNSNGAWGTILSEMLALRAGDASTRYYYGVVKTAYGSGVAGMGYVGGSARAAIGWDNLPSGSGVMAHELGHNMSRQHAPCGGVAAPDPSFPYAGGKIGQWGLDLNTLTLKNPATFADLMGYCAPNWVSDYNWSAMLAYRQGGPNNAPPMDDGSAGLLVWGRIGPAGVVLEPAFRLASAAGRAPAPGANRLELLAADGSLLRTVRFDAEEVADSPSGAERHFAFVIPLDAELERDLAGLRVRAGTRAAAREAAILSSDPAPAVTRANTRQVDIRWDAARYPMVMVRDAVTGDILSFARGGSARLWSRSSDFVLHFSDGVKSVVRQGRIPQ